MAEHSPGQLFPSPSFLCPHWARLWPACVWCGGCNAYANCVCGVCFRGWEATCRRPMPHVCGGCVQCAACPAVPARKTELSLIQAWSPLQPHSTYSFPHLPPPAASPSLLFPPAVPPSSCLHGRGRVCSTASREVALEVAVTGGPELGHV